MLVLLSPSKALDWDAPTPPGTATQPRLLAETGRLIEIMRTKSLDEIAKLMSISDELAALNLRRYAEFETPFTSENAHPAISTFSGDTYQGLRAAERFTAADYARAQEVIRILSGLYGLLRPLDLIQPYRLEMGVRLANPRGRDLYAWWGDQLATLTVADLAKSPGEQVVINCASQEYAKALTNMDADVITPRFEDTSARGKRSVISFYAKRARGEMAAWIVREGIEKAAQIKEFDQSGYRFDAASATTSQPVFVRSFADR